MIKIGNFGNEILPTNEKMKELDSTKTYGVCMRCDAFFECEFDHMPDGWGIVKIENKTTNRTCIAYGFVCSKECHEGLKTRSEYFAREMQGIALPQSDGS